MQEMYLNKPYHELTKGSLTVRYIVIGFVMFVLGFLCGSGNCVSNAYADTTGDMFWKRNTERMADSQEDQAKSLRQIAKELKEIKKSVKK